MIDDMKKSELSELEVSFYRVLMDDILIAWQRCDNDDANKTYKREFIRSAFAGIEGFIWLYKEHIQSVAVEMDLIDAITLLAFEQKEYNISDNGVLKYKENYISSITMFRFASKIAQRVNPKLEIDFNVIGWEQLKTATKIRNRITHPKAIEDFEISDQDVQIVWSGLLWLISSIRYAMKSTKVGFQEFVKDIKLIFQSLIDRDPEITALYESLIRE